MLKPRALLIVLIGVFLLIAGVTATRMINATDYMNRAANYATDHLGELSIPRPLPDSTPLTETQAGVQAVAHYGDAVEVQIARRYRTTRHPDVSFAVTYFYQPIPSGWQLVPAPASFWGESQTTKGISVVIIHPQRDQKLVDNLITAIDPVIQAACLQWECPASILPLTLRFTIEASADPFTYVNPRLTGVPMTREANDDYLSYMAADTLRSLAGQLGKPAEAAYAEIQRQNLYVP